MADELREEFQYLGSYYSELRTALNTKILMPLPGLLKIADHIRLCDHLAKTEAEKHLVYITTYYWENCAKQWIEQREKRIAMKMQQTERKSNIQQSEPRKKWEEMITKSDERLLRSMQIDPGTKKPE